MEKNCEVCKEKFDAAFPKATMCKRCYAQKMSAAEEAKNPSIAAAKEDTKERIARSVALAQAVQIITVEKRPITIKSTLEIAEIFEAWILTGKKPEEFPEEKVKA